MFTYSEFVDQIVSETSRHDRRASIEAEVNAIIRTMHLRASSGAGALPVPFSENLVELTYTIPALPAVWAIPKPATFMGIQAIQLSGTHVKLQERTPRSLTHHASDLAGSDFYYRSGPNVVMSGQNIVVGRQIDIAYLTYLPALSYRSQANRVIQTVNGEYVLASTGGVPTEEQLALETNWMLSRHHNIIREGVKSKLFITLGEREKASAFFSSFSNMVSAMQNTESLSE